MSNFKESKNAEPEQYYEEYKIEVPVEERSYEKKEGESGLISSKIFENENGEKMERLEYRYCDAEGNFLCRAVVEKGLESEFPNVETAEGKEGGTGRTLKKIELFGQDEQGATGFDLLKMANRHGAKIIVADELLENYFYKHNSKTAVVPPLDSPLNIGVFLHELGHVEQFHDDAFENIIPLHDKWVGSAQNLQKK